MPSCDPGVDHYSIIGDNSHGAYSAVIDALKPWAHELCRQESQDAQALCDALGRPIIDASSCGRDLIRALFELSSISWEIGFCPGGTVLSSVDACDLFLRVGGAIKDGSDCDSCVSSRELYGASVNTHVAMCPTQSGPAWLNVTVSIAGKEMGQYDLNYTLPQAVLAAAQEAYATLANIPAQAPDGAEQQSWYPDLWCAAYVCSPIVVLGLAAVGAHRLYRMYSAPAPQAPAKKRDRGRVVKNGSSHKVAFDRLAVGSK
jgi:hypothetical protein